MGLSIIELLLALAISALLLTATTVALNASFHAYATSAESASTQSSTRLVMQRLLGVIRTTTLHDAYDPDDATVTLMDEVEVPSVGIMMENSSGEIIKIYWRANTGYEDPDLGDLWYEAEGEPPAPLLERVRPRRDPHTDEPYIFKLSSRRSRDREDEGMLLLTQATVDLEVEPGADGTLAIESVRGASDAVRMVGSTIPRRNLR